MQIEPQTPEKRRIKADRIADEIRARYVEATNLKRDCITAGRAAVVAAYECGQLLNRAKDFVGHGEFGSWLNQHFSGEISERTAQNWMRLAKTQTFADLEKCNKLKDAYAKCGILKGGLIPDEGEKPPGTAEIDIFGSFIKRIFKLAETVEDLDLSGLPDDQKSEVRARLKAIEERL